MISLWSYWGYEHFILPGQNYLPGALINGLAGIRTQGLRLAKATIFQLIYKPLSVPLVYWIWQSFDF